MIRIFFGKRDSFFKELKTRRLFIYFRRILIKSRRIFNHSL